MPGVSVMPGGDMMAAPARAATQAGPPLVGARNVTRVLSGTVPVTLVAEITLDIGRGEFVGITGPSGSGKSSLLYVLCLLDKPTEGEILINGEPTGTLSDDELAAIRLADIGFIFQFHFLLPEFSILENVMMPMRRLGRWPRAEIRDRATGLLEQLGLGDHITKRSDQLSGGQRQRVAVARALANDPPLILADEPTGSLDSAASEQVFEILAGIVAGGDKSVVAVTHDLDMAARMQRGIRLVDGRIVADGPPAGHLPG